MEIIDILLSLSALVLLEIVLGIDNLIFLSILTEKLPREKRRAARRWGLTFAWVTRLCLLASAVWIVKLKFTLFTLVGHPVSARDVFLAVGGAFLIYKATQEIHLELVGLEAPSKDKPLKVVSFTAVIIQVAIMDIVFSLDSVLTAIGLTSRFWVMAAAITVAIIVMVYASEPVTRFIEKHPTVKMLALSFLILIGTILIADASGYHIPRGYIYFSLAFSLFVEGLNHFKRAPTKPHE